MPAYDEVVRIESPTGNQRQDIANTIHTSKTAIQHTLKHERVRYGETVTVCENRAGWGALGDVKAGETFKAAGETWVSKGLTANPWNAQQASQGGHQEYSAQRVIRETCSSSYVTYSVQYYGISGAIHAQSFLCAQVMVATSVELNFTGVGTTGDVHLALCEVIHGARCWAHSRSINGGGAGMVARKP